MSIVKANEQQQTPVRQTARRSPILISGEREEWVTEEQKHTRRSQRQETTGNRRSSIGCAITRNLRRSVVTCGFLLRRLNHSGYQSDNYRHSSIELITVVNLSGSANESAHSADQ
jgi:hypothetical protein